ncbi:SDR family NAD(P)-dependent oxidoreductase [Pseudonocardia sp. ICBG1293]|uniref:SDR family NAD(P)-dependent oxidoreductase n=1 Tax=Pseudonocardia sp. ICBG1293 TaxID=2844382 RepID=UPI001CCFDC60|nr:SDR family NAD(P)-dependent oxidoreductase [Pseudonocardia sp. ICBG1293]
MLGSALDTVLDRTLVPGYSRIGYLLRRPGWNGARADPPRGALAGRTALVTGAGGGLGEAIATGLVRLGATVHLLVRSRDKGVAAQDRILAAVPGLSRDRLPVQVCDLGELADVRAFATRFTTEVDALDVLVHNAGLLPPERSETSEGNELTLAVHVLGPLLLTRLLADTLAAGAERSGADSRVIIMSSGGMYAQPLRADDLQFRTGDYGGTAAYARTKRMQVVLTGLLADELAPPARHRARPAPGLGTHPGRHRVAAAVRQGRRAGAPHTGPGGGHRGVARGGAGVGGRDRPVLARPRPAPDPLPGADPGDPGPARAVPRRGGPAHRLSPGASSRVRAARVT